jgi:hypothetical protein
VLYQFAGTNGILCGKDASAQEIVMENGTQRLVQAGCHGIPISIMTFLSRLLAE